MSIGTQEARNIFTKQVIEIWDELKELQPKKFLGSFFKKTTTDSLEVSIEVRRGTEKVAVDILRGTNGNRNVISKSSEKIFIPPFYNEYLDATEIDKYDVLFGQGTISVSANQIDRAVTSYLEGMVVLRSKIERAYELQASQVFESGIVQIAAGTNIDFKRKALSMVDLTAAGYWNNTAVNPEDSFIAAGQFLRTTGKATDGVFNVIMGETAYNGFKNNSYIKEKNYNTNIKVIDLHMPQANAEGGVLHGQYSAGSYIFNIWTYPEFYDNSSNVSTPYVNANHAIFLPVNSGRFTFAHGGVPKVMPTNNADVPNVITNVAGDFVLNNYVDVYGKKHVFEIMSAGIAVPVSVDRIYTLVATGTVTNPVVS